MALVLSQTTLLANDSDVDVATDGQTLSVSAVGNASHGTVSILGNGSVQFIADADFHGAASFEYVVSDGHGGTATAIATVQVVSVNDTPVAVGEVISSAEDTTLLISQAALLANDTAKQTCKCKGSRNRLAKALREKTACSPRSICMHSYAIHSEDIRGFSENRDAYSLYLESRVETTKV